MPDGTGLQYMRPDALPAVAADTCEVLSVTGFRAHMQIVFAGTVSGSNINTFADTVSGLKCKEFLRTRFRAQV